MRKGKREEGAWELDQVRLSDQTTVLQIKDKLGPLGGAKVPVLIGKTFDSRFGGSLIHEPERVDSGIPEGGSPYRMAELKRDNREGKKDKKG